MSSTVFERVRSRVIVAALWSIATSWNVSAAQPAPAADPPTPDIAVHEDAPPGPVEPPFEAVPPRVSAPPFSEAQQKELSHVTEKAAQRAAEKTVAEEGKKEFLGISFGVGIAATWIHRSRDARIDEAVAVGEPAMVRVTKRTRAPTRLLLETHYFFPLRDAQMGLGPFLALQAGSGEIIEAVGGGVMLGLRRGTSSSSFNLGLGGIVDASSPVLGNGFEENHPLPAGEMTVRLRNQSVFSWLALFSFSF